ncbi:MAG: HTTM domain-containing protein [Bdellovibrionales bacterium]|nr:HTTM domain-containing protein [Bdellovibrionales bacterium]
MGAFLKKIDSHLLDPVSPYTLAVFRFFFGSLMVWETNRYIEKIHFQWGISKTFFPFQIFSFLPVLNEYQMNIAHIVMCIAAALIALGVFFRFGCFIFFTIYSYIFVIEKSYYNNHYYLIILLTFLLGFTSADKVLSVKSILSKTYIDTSIPFWQILIIRIQLVIVYVGGAIAKINCDWLRGEPMARFLSHNFDMPYVGKYFHLKPVILFFAYGGFLFDLLIAPALLWRRTRIPALVTLVFFHTMNNNLFSIGVFPYLGIASAAIFLEPDLPKVLLHKFLGVFKFKNTKLNQDTNQRASFSNTTYILKRNFLCLYFLIQLLLPFRHLLFNGNVSWTEEGHNFSWHMKLRAKHAVAIFRVVDAETGKLSKVNQYEFINASQARKLTTRPIMIRQFANFLANKYKERGFINPKVFVVNPASLNGRPYQFLVRPDVDLVTVKESMFSSSDWIVPLKENQEIGNYNRLIERTELINEAMKIDLVKLSKSKE